MSDEDDEGGNVTPLFPGAASAEPRPQPMVERYEKVPGGTRIVIFIPDRTPPV